MNLELPSRQLARTRDRLLSTDSTDAFFFVPGIAAIAALAALAVSCNPSPSASLVDEVVASEVTHVIGVPDHGLDPSTVAVKNARGEVCGGVLLASDVVLTARRCVTKDPVAEACAADSKAPATDNPAALHVYDQVPTPEVPWVSAGIAVLTSNDSAVCGADLAVIVLEWPIEGAVAALVSESGIAEGGHVRTVGFAASVSPDAGTADAAPSVEIVREHLPVLQVSPSELAVGEAVCYASAGGPAYDEATGQVVGVLSRPGSACAAAAEFDVFTRTDAFYGLVQQALAWAPSLASGNLDGGLVVDSGRARDAGHAKKPPTDIGAACLVAADCGTGICVSAEGSQYCSRTCAPDDHCPTDFECVLDAAGTSVCVSS